MSILTVKGVRFSISGTKILNGITLDVPVGQTLGLIGPNGSGKTTFFNCISGFNYPDEGSIFLHDHDITSLSPYRRAQLGLGRVFQNFGVFKEMTVLENMITALESRQSLLHTFLPWQKQNRLNREKAMEHLITIKLDGRCNEKAGSLSGGQMRLLEIVRTLAFGAELFLLDEPTAGVAPRMKEDVAHLILELQKLKKTVLVIEHDINFIQLFCSRIVVFDVGRVVMDDSPREIRGSALLREIYFGREEAVTE